MTKRFKICGPALAAALAACPVLAFAQAPNVKIDGSRTVYPVTEAVAEEFQKAKKQQIKVTVGISGTGGGFKKFCAARSISPMPPGRS